MSDLGVMEGMEDCSAKVNHMKVLNTVNGLTSDGVEFFRDLIDSLPEDENSLIEMEETCSSKLQELGIEQELFETVVWFYLGFNQGKEV